MPLVKRHKGGGGCQFVFSKSLGFYLVKKSVYQIEDLIDESLIEGFEEPLMPLSLGFKTCDKPGIVPVRFFHCRTLLLFSQGAGLPVAPVSPCQDRIPVYDKPLCREAPCRFPDVMPALFPFEICLLTRIFISPLSPGILADPCA